jgi:hypothetical protein
MIPTWKYVLKEGEWVFIFDFDKGLNTIANPITGELPEGFLGQTFIDQQQSRTAEATHFRRKPVAFKEAVDTIKRLYDGELTPKGYKGPPAVVVVDTITGLEDTCMNLALTTDQKGGFGLGGGPGQQHWGAQMRYGDEFFRVLMSGEWHIDATAHEEATKDEVMGNWRVRMAITGKKRPSEFPRMFDEMYHHEVDSDGKYMLRTKKTFMYDAKSRLSCDEEAGVEVLDELEDISFGMEPRGWGHILKKVNDYWEAKKKGGKKNG